MPTQPLLDISPDKLFEEHGIAEIHAIQIQLQNEIERKREELRTMVGERYRDLLKAADTITEMKDASKDIIVQIQKITSLCHALQDKRLIGFRQPHRKHISKISDDVEDVAKVIEIKIFLSIPEQIWTALDNKQYLLAAELFLLATHIHLGIEVFPNAKRIMEKFPVLNKQWEVISSCRKIIIDGAHQELKVIHLSYKKAAECLCCIILLEVISYEKLILQFLDFRMQTLQFVLQSFDIRSVKEKLKMTVVILQQTLSALYVCFLEKNGEHCLIYDELEKITGDDAKPTLLKLKQATALPDCNVSALITDFHPKTSNKNSALSQEKIRSKLQEWLKNVENLLAFEVTNLLNLIVDIKRLRKIHEEISSLNYPQQWDAIVEALLNEKKFNIHEKFIRSFMTKRVNEIIEIEWQNNLKTLMSCLKKCDEELQKERSKQSENDVRWFIWKEGKTDTEEILRLKTQGYTSRVTQLCSTLDSCLQQLLTDVELYVGQDVFNGRVSDIDNDFIEILCLLNRCSFGMIKRLSENIKKTAASQENPLNDSSIILRARFLQSLIMLCPNLEKCLRQSQRQLLKSQDDNNGNTWQQVRVYLNEESIEIWRMWKNRTSIKLRNLISDQLQNTVSLRHLLMSKPLNEVITIEEQMEDGASVKSEIRVPSQPSLQLQNLLFQACQLLNAIAPHTLPRSVHEDLVDTFVKNILDHYQKWSQCDPVYQSQAWQLLLDVKLVTLLLVTRDNKDASQLLTDALEKMIDPFDLNVYYPHLQNSLKKSAQKLQGTLGVLINFGEKLPVFNGLKLTQSSSNRLEEPNVLAMSADVPWFPLLPVSTGGARRPESSGFKESSPNKAMVKAKEKENKKDFASSDFVRSAGAFFGAMTGGWS